MTAICHIVALIAFYLKVRDSLSQKDFLHACESSGFNEGENEMLEAIVGDIVGSVYEWNNTKTKEFSFFRMTAFSQIIPS